MIAYNNMLISFDYLITLLQNSNNPLKQYVSANIVKRFSPQNGIIVVLETIHQERKSL